MDVGWNLSLCTIISLYNNYFTSGTFWSSGFCSWGFDDSSLVTSNNAEIHSPNPANMESLFSWSMEYFPSRARFMKIARNITMMSTANSGIYFIIGININTDVVTIRRKNTAHHHKACLRWNSSYPLFCSFSLNDDAMIPIRIYIITALFLSVLLGI